MGGPLIAVPVSALDAWAGGTLHGLVIGGAAPDDYDRACTVDGLAGVIAVGDGPAQALVLADEPATSCYLPEHRAFLCWLAADSEAPCCRPPTPSSRTRPPTGRTAAPGTSAPSTVSWAKQPG
ncbi:Imm21 family immunity protein [Phaeacidiphilus oryzae]|uniref:Imm21 family immunity protein n=1 Tax=Phaeacidiphilus oryzae TaxID=348818 RepID=UPI000A6CD5D1|nr:Imm21 family immunity protein [Phaeacidiphilus oryzae]